MTSSIHGIRLRRIEAEVQRTSYSLHTDPEDSRESITAILAKIDRWKETIPIRPAGDEYRTIPCCSADWFLMKAETVGLSL